MDMDELIRYENENTTLDFKATQYTKSQYEAFIKDIMAMANADSTNDRYIIIGVKYMSNGEREYLGIDSSEFVDSAIYQQLILENIEPDILLDYTPYEFEGKIIGIFRITNCTNRPYMMKKDYNNLRRGDCYIRKGSQQSRMGRRDLDRVFESKISCIDYDKIVSISFTNYDGKDTIQLPALRSFSLPSERAREEITKAIEQKKNESQIKSALKTFNSISSIAYTFVGKPYDQRTIEELEQNLKDVQNTYYEDDLYEVYEINSHRINITILNDGKNYLEDCSIEVTINKRSGIAIARSIYDEPNHNILDMVKERFQGTETNMYPTVDLNKEKWIITQDIGNIRHHIPTEAFYEDLRIVIDESAIDEEIELECRLFAKNLSYPLKRTLKIKVIKPSEELQTSLSSNGL